MNNINYINDRFLSVKVENVNLFLYNSLGLFFVDFNYTYLWVSNREYNNDYQIRTINQVFKFSEERFIFKIDKKDNYSSIINDISDLFREFQMWNLIFTDTQIDDFDKIDFISYGNNECLFFKSMESDVIWIKGIQLPDIRIVSRK